MKINDPGKLPEERKLKKNSERNISKRDTANFNVVYVGSINPLVRL
jgi:hypothetical protein